MAKTPATAAAPAAKKQVQYVLDASRPVSDNLVVMSSLEAYLNKSLKVKKNGSKKGVLGSDVKIAAEGSSVKFTVDGEVIPKRQIKYLTRRYLRKQSLDNYLRVVSVPKSGYKISYIAASSAPTA